MIDKRRVLCLITARGGSKGLPGKNIKEMCGRPLIAWSVERALQSAYIDRTVVSTDNLHIAEAARLCGAEVPFMRPNGLASDDAKSIDVILHALDALENSGDCYDLLVLLEPTSPLREVSDIDGAIELLANNDRIESVVGVAETEACHPTYLYSVCNGLLRPFNSDHPNGIRRQDLVEKFYFLEGSVYASTVDALRKNLGFYHDNTAPWVIERYKSVEIDEMADFVMAEALMNWQLKGKP